MFTVDSQPIPGPSRIDYAQQPISPSPRYPLGSPFSFGSLKGQFYPGCSPGTLMGPLDIPDLKHRRIASSLESNHGSLVKMLSGTTPTANDSMCRDYTCCGLNLTDLHALVEHFEERHVVVVESPSLQPQTTVSAVGGVSSTVLDIDTMDEMDLDIDLDDTSSSAGSHSGASTPSPPLTPVLPFDTTAIRRSSMYTGGGSNSSSQPTSPRLESAFNRYAGYTEFSSMLPGTLGMGGIGGMESMMMVSSPGRNASGIFAAMHVRQKSKSGKSGCVPPSLLSSPSSPQPTPPSSPQPTSTTQTLSRPASSLLLSKPFRCPKPGCNKSYKQANGLKYHVQHGSCNFAPRDESIDCLSEKEAEARLKPYQCQVPPCTRRYKNMNGLRYHYQHSGAHGAIGLALLASGQHEHVHPQDQYGPQKFLSGAITSSFSTSTSAYSSARSSPAPSDMTITNLTSTPSSSLSDITMI